VDGRTCWRPPPLPSAALPSTPMTLLHRRPPPALSPPLLCRLPAPTSPPSSVSRAVAADPAAAPSRSLPRAPPPAAHPALARLSLGGAASAPSSPMVPRPSQLAPPHPCPRLLLLCLRRRQCFGDPTRRAPAPSGGGSVGCSRAGLHHALRAASWWICSTLATTSHSPRDSRHGGRRSQNFPAGPWWTSSILWLQVV